MSAIMDPLTTAVIAMRLKRAAADHYHDLAAAIMICEAITKFVHRHQHLASEIQPGINALNAIYVRQAQRTIPDAPYTGSVEEVDAIDSAVTIYRSVLTVTPGDQIRKAIRAVTQGLDDATHNNKGTP